MSSRLLSVPPLILAATLLACSLSSERAPIGESRENVGRASAPIIKGQNSDASQDAVVLIFHFEPALHELASCTGTLVAPRLVLTARHCVADTDESAACDVTGAPLAGGAVRGDHPANTLYVFTGPTYPDVSAGELTPAGIGQKIIDDGATNVCNHDLALIVLKDPIKDAKILPIRLDGDVTKGEIVTAIGWGLTETAQRPTTRQQRAGIAVLGIGPDSTGDRPVAPNEFEVGESICSGDSGGPAVAETGAIIGVVSRGGNATQPNPQDLSSACVGDETRNFYTKIAPFKDYILQGFELVGSDPWYENGPDPRLAKPGAPCTRGAECRSNMCLADPTTAPTITTCAEDCSVTATCPEGQTCTAEGAARVCRPTPEPPKPTTTKTTTGCATAAGSSSGGPGYGASFAFGLAAFGLAALRRRRT
jgi:MYXO-CTERM domain-containing protein